MTKDKIIIAAMKSWNILNARRFKKKYERIFDVYIFCKKEEFNYKKIKLISPEYIFFPHWSWIISKEIYNNFKCIVFHMTDLPYGRGGSPLQNLIVRGFKKTKISAIEVVRGLDTGAIYIKENLDLNGNAEEIYKRASRTIFLKMIPDIIKNQPLPEPQKGKVVNFKRRKEEDGNIKDFGNIEKIYDCIRMLDAESYPDAFLEVKNLKLKFSKAGFKYNKVVAKVEIEVKNEK